MLVRAIYIYMCVCVCVLCALQEIMTFQKVFPVGVIIPKKFLIKKSHDVIGHIWIYTCRGKMQKISPFDVWTKK